MRYRVRLIAAVLLGLSGCATTYHPNSFTGGYLDQQIGENTYLVTFKANSFTEVENVQNFLLYRCAELTVQKGGDYFIKVEETTDLRHVAGVKPEMRATIKVMKGQNPEDNPKAYDAREVMKYLGPTVGQQPRP
jgi:hypothetical protein